jgi:hypothetical protein
VDVSPPAKAKPDEATAPKASGLDAQGVGMKSTASSGGSRKSSPRKR